MGKNKQLKNGTFFSVEQIKENHLEVIDNNIVRDQGMHRVASAQKTPFQRLLSSIVQKKYIIDTTQLSKIISQVMQVPSLKNTSRMFSDKDEDIIAAYNDSSRRLFETILAKKIINNFLSDESLKLELLIGEIKDFLLIKYKEDYPFYYEQWLNAQNGIPIKEDDNLAHYALLRQNLLVLIAEQHFSKNKFLLDLLDLHYLTHAVSKLASYKQLDPKEETKRYQDNSIFYSNQNRGRLTGYGFNHMEASYHLGIMRSIDKTPYDLRRPKLISSETRCPDRLYMIHPKKARRLPNHWLHRAFANPLNSGYVNGLSGSMLLEIKALLFFLKAIQTQHYTCSFLKYDEIVHDQFQLLKDYLLMVSSFFVYFEGGHTFTEIMSVFRLDNIQESIKNVLQQQEMSSFSIETILVDNQLMQPLIKEALIEAAKYQGYNDYQQSVHQQLKQRHLFEKKINTLLNNFKEKINTLNTIHLPSQKKAMHLLAEIEQYKSDALHHFSHASLMVFNSKCNHAITKALPIFQSSLNWSDYLLNLAKKIVNIIMNAITFFYTDSALFNWPLKTTEVTDSAIELRTNCSFSACFG